MANRTAAQRKFASLLNFAMLIAAFASPVTAAHAAPPAPVSEGERREFTDALRRWVHASRVLAGVIHEPFTDLHAEAEGIITRMRAVQSMTAAPSWAGLVLSLREIHRTALEQPAYRTGTDDNVLRAARIIDFALSRETRITVNATTNRAEWLRQRPMFDALLSAPAASWADGQMIDLLRTVVDRLAPNGRVRAPLLNNDERALIRIAIHAMAALVRHTSPGSPRPAALMPSFDERFRDLLTMVGPPEIARLRAADLLAEWDAIVSRRARALTPSGSLDEADLAFARRNSDASAARVRAAEWLGMSDAMIAHTWTSLDHRVAVLRTKIANMALNRADATDTIDAKADPAGARARAAAQAIRTAVESTSPFGDVIAGLSPQLQTQREASAGGADARERDRVVSDMVDSAHATVRALEATGRWIDRENARGALRVIADALDAGAAVTSTRSPRLNELEGEMDSLHATVEALGRLGRTRGRRLATIDRLSDRMTAAAEAIEAIRSIREFEGRVWHPGLPSPAPNSRWSIPEARRIRAASLSPGLDAHAVPDAAPELPVLPERLRQLALEWRRDCAPGV